MRHHLRKAREVYAEDGVLETVRSAIRYLPVELNNAVFRLRHGNGTHVMDEDWDNLFILDACRFDMFTEYVDLEGTLEPRISLGSSSEEFMERNFAGATFHDTVYINANPYIAKLGLDNGTFHAVINCLDAWDDKLETIPPGTVVEAARDVISEFPDKRIIVHFMQPHAPFIGDAGREIGGGGWTMDRDIDSSASIWERGSANNVSDEAIWKGYVENLKLVIDELRPLLSEVDGKSVVTSDHGNLVGERLSPIPTRKKYGHPYGVHTEELVKIPWFIVDDGRRRDINEDPPVEQGTVSEETVTEHLEALGYK